MTAVAIALAVLCQLCLVAGQLVLKRGMDPVSQTAAGESSSKSNQAVMLAAGVFLLTLWFFLWLGLLRDWNLSTLFPFEALTQVLLAFGAWIFLKERLTLSGWAGIVLISVGVTLVARG